MKMNGGQLTPICSMWIPPSMKQQGTGLTDGKTWKRPLTW